MTRRFIVQVVAVAVFGSGCFLAGVVAERSGHACDVDLVEVAAYERGLADADQTSDDAFREGMDAAFDICGWDSTDDSEVGQ